VFICVHLWFVSLPVSSDCAFHGESFIAFPIKAALHHHTKKKLALLADGFTRRSATYDSEPGSAIVDDRLHPTWVAQNGDLICCAWALG
jgi:hypothetical protein